MFQKEIKDILEIGNYDHEKWIGLAQHKNVNVVFFWGHKSK